MFKFKILKSLVFAVLIVGIAGAKTNADNIALFLPFVSSQYPGVVNRLQATLDERKVDAVRIVTAEHWHEYQQGLRAGRPGVYLAHPHFAAWAIERHEFKPIIRLATPLSYVIASHRNDKQIFEMNDLANHTVCAHKPLNLDYLLINNAFDNPLLSAKIEVVPSVFEEMRRSSSVCRGFALSNQQYERIALSFPDRYIRVQQSDKFNNLVLLSDRISWRQHSQTIDQLRSILVSEQGRDILAPVLTELAPQAAWVNAKPSDYPASYAESLRRFWR